MNSSARPRVAHLSSAHEESYLLGLQLEHEALEFDIVGVASRAELATAIAMPVSMVIADLPLPWEGAESELDELQRLRPDVPVVFRWGGAGSWSVEDATSQLGRSVRNVLALGLERDQTVEQRRQMLLEAVRYQTAHLQLGKLDTWDWERALRDATEIMADTMHVERVSAWRLDARHGMLECEILFTRTRREHFVGGALPVDAAYSKAIEAATFLAAHDAQHNPRTSAFAASYLTPLGIASMLDAPIRTAGKVVGVVCLEHVGPPRHWHVVEQCAAATFAATIGRILEARERRQLEEQWQEAQRLEVIGQMAGAIAHDFGNLSTVIVGFSENLLLDTAAGDPRHEALLAIHDAGASASSLVRQLLAYSKPHQHSSVRRVDVCALIRNMEPLVQRLLGSAVECTFDVSRQPLWVEIDPSQLHRVLLNLAANSRDAMPEGGAFQLVVNASTPAAHSLHRHGVVLIRAIDNGAGIPADVLPHIFKPLYTTKTETGGTGLGLSAARAICLQAGGSIRVESEPGKRTCFSIELPQVDAPSTLPTQAQSAECPAISGVVLVVDDTPAMATLVGRILERRGCRVEMVTSPEIALKRAHTLGHTLTLLITDFSMRGMSGAQLIEQLRRTHPHLRALVMTGLTDAREVAHCAELPNTMVLPKPFESDDLIARVRDLMAGAQVS